MPAPQMAGSSDMMLNKRDTPTMMRSIYSIVMGVLWTGVGLFFIFHRKWGFDMNLNSSRDVLLANIFGGAAVLYGLFRIYRGIKQ